MAGVNVHKGVGRRVVTAFPVSAGVAKPAPGVYYGICVIVPVK